MENSNFRSHWNPNPNRHDPLPREKPTLWNYKPNRHCSFPEENPKNPNPNSNRHGHFPKEKSRNPNPNPKPEPISIPNHFMEAVAKRNAAAAAAIKMQKLLRGFLVRKKMRILKAVDAEIGEIEIKIERDRALIRSDDKERIRVHEMLMKMLLRLDSVCGVRDFRRKVIMKAISLQDRVDSLVGGDVAMADGETLEIPEDGIKAGSLGEETLECVVEFGPFMEETQEIHEDEIKAGPLVEETLECIEFGPFVEETLKICKAGPLVEETLEFPTDEPMANQETLDSLEAVEDGLMPPEAVAEDESKAEALGFPAMKAGSCADEPMGNQETVSYGQMPISLEGEKSVMERVLAENKSLKGVVGGLVKRVEELEKTVAAMEERRKKKREASSELASEKNRCCHRKTEQ